MATGPTPTAPTAAARVSIVIPAFNRAETLAATLESVRAQTMASWELVVFDDGSTDATLAVADRFSEVDPRIRVERGPNRGVASARNRGFAATDHRTEFVIFLDSDDVWPPYTLEVLVSVLDARPELASAYGLAQCIDVEGRPIPGDDLVDRMRERVELRGRSLIPLPAERPLTFAALAHHNWVVTPGIHLVRRPIQESVGQFDSAVDPADDWDHAVRVSRHGDIGFIPRIVLHWRRHPNTLTNTSPKWKRAYYGVRRKMLIDPMNTADQLRAAQAGYRYLVRSSLSDARRSFVERDMPAALRNIARSIECCVRYGRAMIPLMMRVARRRLGGEAA